MTPNPYPLDKPLPLPKQGSWPETVHVFDRDSANALLAAEAAGRPLLVRGEPGTGKSQLARAAAVVQKRLFLSVVVNAATECQDLQWHYDAVGRLAEAQNLSHRNPEDISHLMNPRRFLTPGPLWWAFDCYSAARQQKFCAVPLAQPPNIPFKGWTPDYGSVLLIDEIDKADTDLPNGLLETLGNGDFPVPYLGGSVRQQGGKAPLVIITTNEDRELPPAFLRRCLVLQLQLPQDDGELLELLAERGEFHFPGRCSVEVRRQAAEMLLDDRKAARREGLPAPGQAEYLDLLRALSGMADTEEAQLQLLDEIGQFVLRKNPTRAG